MSSVNFEHHTKEQLKKHFQKYVLYEYDIGVSELELVSVCSLNSRKISDFQNFNISGRRLRLHRISAIHSCCV